MISNNDKGHLISLKNTGEFSIMYFINFQSQLGPKVEVGHPKPSVEENKTLREHKFS